MVMILGALALVVLLFILGASIFGSIMTLVGMLVMGLVVGALARLVVPGRQHIGILMTALIGAVGAMLGGILANEVFGWGDALQFLTSVAVAAVLVAIAAGMDREPAHDRGITRG